MGSHPFNFDGGDELSTMGATWFVSYAYYNFIDKAHRNWDNVSTVSTRKTVYNRTHQYFKFWLTEVLKMSDANLDKNTIDLNAFQVKSMAKEILEKISK